MNLSVLSIEELRELVLRVQDDRISEEERFFFALIIFGSLSKLLNRTVWAQELHSFFKINLHLY